LTADFGLSLGKVDAMVGAAGQAKSAPFAQLSDADFRFWLDSKLMGQVNLVRFGWSISLTEARSRSRLASLPVRRRLVARPSAW
jgi:NADP-dependent 3-hydroxy acid dehydrogenase YdfG